MRLVRRLNGSETVREMDFFINPDKNAIGLLRALLVRNCKIRFEGNIVNIMHENDDDVKTISEVTPEEAGVLNAYHAGRIYAAIMNTDEIYLTKRSKENGYTFSQTLAASSLNTASVNPSQTYPRVFRDMARRFGSEKLLQETNERIHNIRKEWESATGANNLPQKMSDLEQGAWWTGFYTEYGSR